MTDLKRLTVGGEEIGPRSPNEIPRPRLVLDWERRARVLDLQLQSCKQEIEAQAQEIVNLKEEIAQQDERMARMTERIKKLELETGGRE